MNTGASGPYGTIRTELNKVRQAAIAKGMTGATGPASAFSLSTARIPLPANGGSWLTYLFNTKEAAKHKSINIDLDYQVNNIEHQIGAVPGVTGYKASSWLSFVLPIENSVIAAYGSQGKIGDIQIPIPLRAYPTPPSVTDQLAVPGPTGATGAASIKAARSWAYNYTYQEVEAAQDSIDTQVQFNVPEQQHLPHGYHAIEPPLDIALAQFSSAYADIKKDFVGSMLTITTESKSTDAAYKTTAVALSAFAFLASRVAQAWSSWREVQMWRGMQAGRLESYSFSITEVKSEHDALQVKVNARSPGADQHMPDVLIPDSPYVPVKTAGPTGTAMFKYQKDGPTGPYLNWADRYKYQQRSVSFSGLDILEQQNAWGGVSIVRNRGLLPDVATNPAFIYQTPLVKYVNKLVPLLINNEPIDIAQIDATGSTTRHLAKHLQALFKALLSGSPNSVQKIKVECSYSYNLQDNFALEEVILPVTLSVPFSFAIPADWDIGSEAPYCTGNNSFTCELTQKLTAWMTEHGLKTNTKTHNNGKLLLIVSVYSNNNNKQPLLKLENLSLEIDKINWD